MEPLKFARKRNVPWVEVARNVRQLEAEPDSSGMSPIHRAEQLSGYSANQLRRMIAGMVFLNELARTDPVTAEWLGVPKFSHAEMLAKLWRRDREATLRLLRSKPVLRYEGLSRLFDNMAPQTASPMSAGKRAQKNFEQKCLDVLLDKETPFAPFGAGSYQILRARVHHPYCRPALLVRMENDARRVQWGGLDFVARQNWDDATLRQIMIIGVEAGFLDRHFVVFSDGYTADQALRAIRELGFGNVQTAVLHDNEIAFSPLETDTQSSEQRRRWAPPSLNETIAQYSVDG
ncbi:hypothetical protein [Devosia faecipullorum]|uniref:hypothetical protein n=1 Tax=Devosia faecipullorum TaxID=2755039 RepID=UPI00187BB901|nr:hypothetical protein [Devosia faecipullorum]MBE7733264.1 hypothetical protein [Devosia faecipullorum]